MSVRVCNISDIECSRNCGEGPCKREGNAAQWGLNHPAFATSATENSRADALMDRDTSKTNAEQGLYRKFDVRRVDGSDQPGGKHHDCEYFVLDMTHDQHARAALRAYADSCAPTHPELSADLIARYALAPVEQPVHESLISESVIKESPPKVSQATDAPAAAPIDRIEELRDKWKLVDGDMREGEHGLITYHVEAFDEGLRAGGSKPAPSPADERVAATQRQIDSIADGLFDHTRITDKTPALSRDDFREIIGSAIAEWAEHCQASRGTGDSDSAPSIADHLDSLEGQLRYFLGRVKDFPTFEMIDLVAHNIRERLEKIRARAASATETGAEGAASETLRRVYDLVGMGELARTPGILIKNLENMKRRSDCLSGIEMLFTYEVPDEDYPGEMGEDCDLNWGHDRVQYVEAFKAALPDFIARHPEFARSPAMAAEATPPSGYAYRYPSLDGTVIRFNGGKEVNGSRPIEAIPYWFAAPQPAQADARVGLTDAKNCANYPCCPCESKKDCPNR